MTLFLASPRHAELVSASIPPRKASVCAARRTLKQVQGDENRADGGAEQFRKFGLTAMPGQEPMRACAAEAVV